MRWAARRRPPERGRHARRRPARTSPLSSIGLDATRERAFAQRRPELLDDVYASTSLRDQDAQLIDKLIPEGCGLLGVRTTYSDIHPVSMVPTTVVLTARASLAASTLECGSITSATAPAVPSTGLRITLVRGGGGYLISALQA